MQDCKQQQKKLLQVCSWKMQESHKHLVQLSKMNPPHNKIRNGVARELCAKHLFGAESVNHFMGCPSEYTFLLFRGGLTLEDFYRITDEFMEDLVCTLSSAPYYCSISPPVAQIYMASAALIHQEPIGCIESITRVSQSAWNAFEAAFKFGLLPAVTKGVA